MKRRVIAMCGAAALVLIACQGLLFGAIVETAPPPESKKGLFTKWETFTEKDGLPNKKVFAVWYDPRGFVWAGTDAGLARLNLETKKFDVWRKADGLAFDSVAGIYVDKDGIAWIATMQGLSRFDGKTFTNYFQPKDIMSNKDRDTGLSNNVVYAVTKYKDEVWIATTDGTSRFNPTTNTWKGYYLHNAPLDEVWCYGISADEARGMVYIAPWGGGMVEYDYAADHFQAYLDPDNSFAVDLMRNDGPITQMSTGTWPDASGAVWVSSYFGLSRYDHVRWFEYSQAYSGIASNFVNAIKAKDMTVYACTDKGMSTFNWDTQLWTNYKRLEGAGAAGMIEIRTEPGKLVNQLITETGIPYDFTWSVHFQGDRDIWVGTSKGLGHGMMEE